MLTIAGGVLLGLLGFAVLTRWLSSPGTSSGLTKEQLEEYLRRRS